MWVELPGCRMVVGVGEQCDASARHAARPSACLIDGIQCTTGNPCLKEARMRRPDLVGGKNRLPDVKGPVCKLNFIIFFKFINFSLQIFQNFAN